jgi:hypothetical protein
MEEANNKIMILKEKNEILKGKLQLKPKFKKLMVQGTLNQIN